MMSSREEQSPEQEQELRVDSCDLGRLSSNDIQLALSSPWINLEADLRQP